MILTRHLSLFEELNSANVEYLLVGGVAAIAYGVPRATQDIDILINPTIGNAKKLLGVFKKLKLGTASLISPEELLGHEVVLFRDYFRIDVLTRLKAFEFADVYYKRNTIQVGDKLYIPVLSLDDLLSEKKQINRDKDSQDIAVLQILQKKKRNKKKIR